MAEPHDSFIHAGWKIERAKKHLWDFHHAEQSFIASNKHFISVERHPDTGRYITYLGPSLRAPTEISLIVGDAIHNARAALDHAWMGVVRSLDPKTKSKLTFPVDEERAALERRLAGTEVCKAFPAVTSVILDEIRPYRIGNRDCWLFALNRLDNRDKHNMLIVSRASIHVKKAKLICPEVLPPPAFIIDLTDIRIHANAPMPFAEWTKDVPADIKPQFETEPEVAAYIAFDNDVEGVGLMPVGQAIDSLVRAADNSLSIFRGCFPDE